MQNVAHRGASAYAPENTRAAFDLAIEMDADAIKTDVQMTFDGRLVLFHDVMVDRTSNGSGPLSDHSLEELQALDVGGWFGNGQRPERILTLDELFDEYADRLPLVLEIKDARVTGSLIESIVKRDLLSRVHVTSFFWSPLLEARAVSRDVTLGFLTPQFEPALIDRIAKRGFNQICPNVSTLTSHRVRLAKHQGLTVRAWGVDQRYHVERLFETGADGATTNWPDWIDSYRDRESPILAADSNNLS
jgi:glycerophosphoryl diester phosphodiesterase